MVCVCCDPLGYCCPEGRTPDSVLFTITGVTEKPSGSPALSFNIIGSYVLARVGNSCVSWNTQIEPSGPGSLVQIGITLQRESQSVAQVGVFDGVLVDFFVAGSGLVTPEPLACDLLSGGSFSGIAPSTRSLAQSIYLNISFTIEPA